MTEAQSCNEDKPPARGDKQRMPSQIGTPNNASRFAQHGPVKATTVMLQGVASVTDSAAAQGKPGMTSPFVVEKKVADIAGILQMRAPMKDAQQSQAAMKNRQPPGTFFTTQAAGKVAATTSTFYAPKYGSQQASSQEKFKEEMTPDYKKLSESFRASTTPKMLPVEPSLVRKLMEEEKDERYRYLLKHGNVHFVEADTYSIYVELPQIPGILIVYRRPSER